MSLIQLVQSDASDAHLFAKRRIAKQQDDLIRAGLNMSSLELEARNAVSDKLQNSANAFATTGF